MPAPRGASYPTGTHLSFMRGNTMKKIEIRKTGPVRLTSAAHPLYGGICGIRVA
jgi:hypothetical protein